MKKHQLRRKKSDRPEYEAIVLHYLSQLGFSIDTNVGVSLGNRRFEADAVGYLDQEMRIPNIVVEMKSQLPRESTILDASVQQAFAIATALGEQVRFLLITDGIRHHWFERNAQTQSLEPIANAPDAHDLAIGVEERKPALRPITGSERYLQLLQIIVDKLRGEGLGFGLRMGIEINRQLNLGSGLRSCDSQRA